MRIIANRQLYTFILNVEDSIYAKARPAFDALVAATKFSPPNTGADLLAKNTNRWIQREYRFALDLPEGWQPALAPSEVALLFANGPPRASGPTISWCSPIRIATPTWTSWPSSFPTSSSKRTRTARSSRARSSRRARQKALETVVRTDRGPFSMTVIERRFRGDRFDYEVKYTVETKRFDQLAPKLRESLESFREMPGDVPGAGSKKAA